MKIFGKNRGCHSAPVIKFPGLKVIALMGSPNVGKSAIFNKLTGAYVTVSNYPGTTVEITVGKCRIDGERLAVIDTPGAYSLLPLTEDHRVARRVLLNEKPRAVIHVVDAKNLERMLPFTLELIEADLPVVLDLNIIDEAERIGMKIDINKLRDILGIPVVATDATTGRGIETLKEKIKELLKGNVRAETRKISYGKELESFLEKLGGMLKNEYPISKRAIGLLLLQGDSEIEGLIMEKEGVQVYKQIRDMVERVQSRYGYPLTYIIALRRREESSLITAKLVSTPKLSLTLTEKLSRAMTNPLTGIPILMAVLYLGLYQFVGVFGAGTLVDFLEGKVFTGYINPFITDLIMHFIPYKPIQELLVGEYGVITLGVRYAVAIILPIVGTFFLVFSIIEDTGYLPRMAMLIDRVFKKIGLNGRAVIPMTLGFGCDTMATIVTRTLETKREKIIATLLLALAIPCSAQLGVILAILSGNLKATLIWALTVVMVLLFVGYLTAKLMPGEHPSFFIEVPPLRKPRISNVLMKTYTRMEWYFTEVFPLFILASVLIWMGKLTGLFNLAISVLQYPVNLIGLPSQTAVAFLFGFFRRDYGAAGLYDLQQAGVLSGVPLVVAAVTLTLFVPCIAQFSITIKERGLKTAVAMALFIFPFAFLTGFLVKLILTTLVILI